VRKMKAKKHIPLSSDLSYLSLEGSVLDGFEVLGNNVVLESLWLVNLEGLSTVLPRNDILKAHGFCIDDDTVQLFREGSPCISVSHHFRERLLRLRCLMRVVHLLKGHEDFVGASNIHIVRIGMLVSKL
jgi:hypothetical protein